MKTFNKNIFSFRSFINFNFSLRREFIKRVKVGGKTKKLKAINFEFCNQGEIELKIDWQFMGKVKEKSQKNKYDMLTCKHKMAFGLTIKLKINKCL